MTTQQDLITQIQKCTKLLQEKADFETRPENGYGHIKVQYDDNYEKPLLWVAHNADPLMTLIDLQQLEKHLTKEIQRTETVKEYQKQIQLDLMKCNDKARDFFIRLIQSDKITILNQSKEGWNEGYCVNVLSIKCKINEPVSFDDGRLKFKKDEELYLIATIDEREPLSFYGSTSVSQLIEYADGDWDLRDYDYLDFDKEQNI